MSGIGKSRRRFLKAAGAAGITLSAGCSGLSVGGGSGEFPNQPITFKVIADTGGGMDYYTRLVAKYIRDEDLLPVDIRIENLTMSLVGRFNNIYNSDADGYTYGNAWPGFARFQAQGVDGVEFDMKKITPMPSAGGNIRAITVGPDVDVNSGQELLDFI
jgi:tripartite-type tricarboxylate transporter receptor subunit TctC